MASRIGAAILLFLFLGEAQADGWRGVFAYVDWTSDYRFYGMSSSNREPIEQGGLHWLLPNNFYVGVFASGVRFQDFRNTSYETDFYGGRHFYFDSNDLNLELLYSVFPNQAGHASYKPPDYVFPTFGDREMGLHAPVGKLAGINAILIIILAPMVGRARAIRRAGSSSTRPPPK